ncbi:MAG: hypothetical protein ACRD3S_09445, partial [Terracidiphilus sp.]
MASARAQSKPAQAAGSNASAPVVICEGPQALAKSSANLQAQAAQQPQSQAPPTITLQHRPPAGATPPTQSPTSAPPAPPQTIALIVPQGTPIQVILDKDVRIHKVGQPIQGRVAEAIYSFDKLVIPANSRMLGKITRIEKVSGGRRAEDVLNA